MPIYMDRHDVSEAVTAENVAQLHREDLKIEHQFNCIFDILSCFGCTDVFHLFFQK